MAEYIEREKAISICQSHYEHCLKMHDFSGDSVAYDIRSNIQGLPAADVVEVKHGEWIKHKPDPEAMKKWHDLGIAKGMSENSIFWSCSCCNGWGTPAHKYCSHCGAKMDGKEGAEDD